MRLGNFALGLRTVPKKYFGKETRRALSSLATLANRGWPPFFGIAEVFGTISRPNLSPLIPLPLRLDGRRGFVAGDC